MDATLSKTKTDRPHDGYDQFSKIIRQNFTDSIQAYGGNLFTTDAVDLFDVFLAQLPEDARQHYTCNACRKFVTNYGGLVSISPKGFQTSVMWNALHMPEFFSSAVMKLGRIVTEANVTGVFLSDQQTWGTPRAGEWNHMHVVPRLDMVTRNPGRIVAERLQDYQGLRRSLDKYTMDTIERTLTLLQSGQLYRGEKFLGVTEWFRDLAQSLIKARDEKVVDNIVWLAVATAPAGFTHVGSTTIGTLLDDVQDGLDFAVIARKFDDKLDPATYQHSQVAPTEGGKAQAEKLIKELGLENSLKRRYAVIGDIPFAAFLWKGRQMVEKPKGDGVFANVATKQKATPAPTMTLPLTNVTWRKFREVVLPVADKIEVKVENSNRFAALVTAADPTAPNILQWDNPTGWYYNGGMIDGEMRRRVLREGGKYHGNAVRATFMWDNYSDLDIHAVTTHDGHIFFGDKQGRYGYLDVDMNVSNYDSLEPVENIRWVTAPDGDYEIYVHCYTDRNHGHNPYTVELEVNGKVYTFKGVLGGKGSKSVISRFSYRQGVTSPITGNASVDHGTAWNLDLGQFYPVSGIVKSPNLWGDNPSPHVGEHTFFLVDGCKDTEDGRGRGFINETLIQELRPIRKTLEAFTDNEPIQAAEGAPACGLGFSKDGEWNLVVRVTTNNIVAEYNIERWD